MSLTHIPAPLFIFSKIGPLVLGLLNLGIKWLTSLPPIGGHEQSQAESE